MIYKDLCFSPSVLPVFTNLGPCWGPLAFHLSVNNVLLCMYCSTTSLVTCQGQIWDSHPSKYVMPKKRTDTTVSLSTPFATVLITVLMKTMNFQSVSFSES